MMYWPTETEELLIIFCLGSEDERLYAHRIAEKILKEEYCSKQILKSKSSVNNSINKLKKEKIIQETGEYVKTKGASGKVLQLTEAGEYIYDEIWDLYPVLEYITPFQKLIFECDKCTEDERESCFKVQRKDLDITLENLYNMREGARKRIINAIKPIENTPMSLAEFVFWLTMNKVAKKRLNDKYDTYLKIVNSHVDDKVTVISK